MNDSSYPAAYCVKCKTHTDTKLKHTVILKNNTRALTGFCPQCQSKVYQFLPRKSTQLTNVLALKSKVKLQQPKSYSPVPLHTVGQSDGVTLLDTFPLSRLNRQKRIKADFHQKKKMKVVEINLLLATMMGFLGGMIMISTLK